MKIKITALLLLLCALAGCNNNKAVQAEDTHEESLTYTQYTDKTELFVEFAPLVVGETSVFATHLTVLGEYFKPLVGAKVTVSLTVNGNEINSSTDVPATLGLYKLNLKPNIAGKGTLVFNIASKNYTDKITIQNITVYPTAAAAHKASAHEAMLGDISYLKEQAWKVEFASQPVTKQPFYEVIKTSGQLLSAPGDEMVVAAKADGIVTFSGTKSIVGSQVNQGTPLFTISGNNLAQGNIDAAVREAKMNYLKLKADYERAEELAKDKIISQKEFQTTRLLYDNARNEYSTVSKNYSAKGQGITAPMSGFIKLVTVTDGQYVTAGTPLATISKNKRLLLQANVSQKYFSRLPQITSANFSLPNGTTYDTKNLNGKVASYGRSTSANSSFIPVTFEIDNVGDIVSGSAVQVFLKSNATEDALIIPLSAVMEEQGIFYVFVQTGGERFRKAEVTLGANDGKDVQVLSGIVAGERVVTKGAYQIKLAAASGALPQHSHEH